MYHLYRSHPNRTHISDRPLLNTRGGFSRLGRSQSIAEATDTTALTTPNNHPETHPAGIRFVLKENAEAVGQEAAVLVAQQLCRKPDSSIVFPTGNTPIPLYQALREAQSLDWQASRLFQLDEYLSPHPDKAITYESFAAYMERELWGHVAGQKFYIQDYLHDPANYEQLAMQNNGPDLVVLGIGTNGHVAFNEPGSQPDSPTRVIDLTEETLRSNFKGLDRAECPRQAMSMGLRAILSAGEIILMATGESKQGILQRAFNPQQPPALDCPASWLKRHPNVLILTDFEVSFPTD